MSEKTIEETGGEDKLFNKVFWKMEKNLIGAEKNYGQGKWPFWVQRTLVCRGNYLSIL
jgi:hypothetical protein